MLSRFISRIFIPFLFCFPLILKAQTPETVILCSNSNYMVSNALSGVVYDPGGPDWPYSDNEYCQLLLDPGCAASVVFYLPELHTEPCCDFLAIYDADNPGGLPLAEFRGDVYDQTFELPYYRLLVVWYTDGSVISSGFQLNWEVTPTTSVTPDLHLTVSDTTPAFHETIQFSADAGGVPSVYFWDFGDSTTASGVNPTHQYTQPGAYTVQCIATGCEMQSDTATLELMVQPPSVVQINPDTLVASGACSGSTIFSFSIKNDGDGDLLFSAYLNNMPFDYTLTPNFGEIAPDSSLTIIAEIFTIGAFPTTYYAELVVLANDSAMLPVIAQVQMEVEAAPAAILNPTALDFGTIRQLEATNQYLVVYSGGCSRLILQNASVDNAAFSTDVVTGIELDPGNGYYLYVYCSPQDTGLITGNLLLETNAGNYTVPMSVFVIPSPVAVVSPETIDVAVSCGDSASVVFYLKNEGAADLTITSAPVNFPAKVLFLTPLSEYTGPQSNMAYWMAIQNPGTQFIDLPNYLQQDELRAQFNNADMVVLSYLSGFGSYTPEQIRTEIENFAARGGTVLITGTPYVGVLQTLGIFQTTNDYSNLYGEVFYPSDPQQEFVQNIDFQNNVSYENNFGLQIQDADYVPVIRQFGYDVLGYRHVGSGRVIYMAHENSQGYYQNQLIVQNIYKASLKNRLDYELPNMVPAGDSVAVTVHINTTGLWAGSHQRVIGFYTDDPQRQYIEVPVNVTVSGSGELAVPAAAVQFGVMQQFSAKTVTVVVQNIGCNTLSFNDLSFTSGDFTVLNPPASLSPWSQVTLQITFQPQSAGHYTDTLFLSSDGGNAAIALSAIVVGAPVAGVTPGSLTALMDCDQSNMYSLSLANTGTVTYQYSTTHTGPVKVATLEYGVYYDRLYNMMSTLKNQIPEAEFIPINTTDPAVLTDSLKKADILVITYIDNFDPATYISFNNPIHEFMDRGGVVLMTGTHFPDILSQMGLISGFTNFSSTTNDLVVNTLPSHPMSEGLQAKGPVVTYQLGAGFPESDGFIPALQLRIDQSYDTDYLSWKKEGNGFLVWWGQPFDYSDTLAERLMRNIIEWAYQPLPPGTTLVSGQSGNLPSNSTQMIQLTISGNDLPGNDYPGQIRLYGNDPVHNPLIIPVLLQISDKPCATFSAVQTNCSATVFFKDETQNALSSWYWTFGDGFESFVDQPEHTYTNEGAYTVTMVGCNAFGCDTTQQVITIGALDSPTAACALETQSTCCDAGINSFQLGSINHTSGNAAAAGYEDFSCAVGTELVAGDQYEVNITTGNQSDENVAIWIDLNDDGAFSPNEKIFSDIQYINHHGYLIVPNNAVKGKRLRLRAVAGYEILQPCGSINNGQAEDYYVIVKQAVGTEESTTFSDAAISPNPSASGSRLTFSIPNSESAILTVINTAGQVVESRTMELQAGAQQIELTHRTAGVYSVRLQTSGSTLVRNWVCLER